MPLYSGNTFSERKCHQYSFAALEIDPDGPGLTTLCIIRRDEIPL